MQSVEMSRRTSNSEPTAAYERHGSAATISVGEHDGIADPKPKSKAGRFVRLAVLAVIVAAAVAVAVIALAVKRDEPAPPPVSPAVKGCTHPVYCQGPLLEAVQLAQVFPDQKTFVDMPIIGATSAQEVVDTFLAEISEADRRNATILRQFVNRHFGDPESYIEKVTPRDFTPNPAFLSRVSDPNLREFAGFVHHIWKNLTRVFNTSAFCSDCYSNLDLKHPFVIPGGRFREFYYWDSFWILKGLIVSELHETARDLVLNIANFVDTYGFMPNGARKYYLDRSQPPVLALMVELLVNATNGTAANRDFIVEILPTLVREHEFWGYDLNTLTFSAGGRDVKLYRYNAKTAKPRCESYLEDVRTLAETGGARTAENLFSAIHGGAETGWDFSSRWFALGSTNMTTIMTGRIAPLDLNVILLRGAEIISELAGAVGDGDTRTRFAAKADTHREDLLAAFRWSGWNDVIVPLDGAVTSRNGYYASIATAGFVRSIVDRLTAAEQTTIKNRIRVDRGGVPTSDTVSGQQWDSIDAWPPLQWFAAEAFGNLGSVAQQQALIRAWVNSNYCGWRRHGTMFEKYDAQVPGERAAGGEYLPQDGFGWTNGVVLDFIAANPGLVAPNCSAL